MPARKKIKPVRKSGRRVTMESILSNRSDSEMIRRRDGHPEMKINGKWQRLEEVPLDPANPSPEVLACFPQIGDDPEPEWISMAEARAVTGLNKKDVLAINGVQTRAIGRDRLVHWPSLRKAITAALMSPKPSVGLDGRNV